MFPFTGADEIRTMFSRAMSDMYRQEVPQYGALLELVAEVNAGVLAQNEALRQALVENDELDRLDLERHGAIRLGTAEELSTIRRLFAVMGMYPVGYYDLAGAGVPVHATAFRPIDEASLRRNPFRVFTSLLRLDLIEEETLRKQASDILSSRRIFTKRAIELIERFEEVGGLTQAEATEFVQEALGTFRWHKQANVDAATYKKLHDAHRLIADVVSFKGPHINHLTPRTLDIEEVQRRMPQKGITPKPTIEGPPGRHCEILLRQTSFKALEEPIAFVGQNAGSVAATHTARFGEIEQRGIALTPKGRQLYDRLLKAAMAPKPADRSRVLREEFARFPDDWNRLRTDGLAFFRYSAGKLAKPQGDDPVSIDHLVETGHLVATPITYEDFLPVSAAGIFQSNLGPGGRQTYTASANQENFEAALGAVVADEFELYAALERASLEEALVKMSRLVEA